ncbi:MAG: RluA family pseudouridine synthase [Phycisphaerales bacterium]
MPAPKPSEPAGDDIAQGGLIGPGGKISEEAIREAAELDLEDDGLRRVTFTLTRDLNKRLDKYLQDRIAFMSRTQLQRLIDEGGVEVNGRAPKPSTKLRLGDVVEVVVPVPPSKEIQGEEIPIDVLYEDAQILVLNKSPDIIVHPARSHNSGTLLNALVWYFEHKSEGSLSGVGEEFARPGVVHRLDRKTSGVMVIAKDDEAHWRLGRQFEKRTTDKRYLALVEGLVERDVEVIDLPIGPHPSRVKGMREKMVVRHDEWGKPAVTICRVRERYRTELGHYTLVELELKTGRTHQIRVHLSHTGYPIVGDDMYGGHVLRDGERVVMDRQALHAAVLGFTHPHTREAVAFTAPLRGDMAGAIALLRERGESSGVRTPAGATIDMGMALAGLT